MTGFGRSEGICTGTVGASAWAWELRAVNGKGLDIRLKLPSGMERLEPKLKKNCSVKISRGNVQAVLTLRNTSGGPVPTLNEAALEQVMGNLAKIEKSDGVQPSTAAQILALRGVMDLAEPTMGEAEIAKLETELLTGLDAALDSLNQHRLNEGKALAEILLGQLENINELTKRAEADPSRTSKAIADKLNEQLAHISDLSTGLDKDRLYQEVALLATKADIREELDRLFAHTNAARELISKGSPVGRKLEFLAQEFNRESNTLCSKSNAVSLTEIGLELKVVIDQFREQILNVE